MPDKISQNEAVIISMLRTLKPFEEIRITADRGGKVNNFIVIRSSKVILGDDEPTAVR